MTQSFKPGRILFIFAFLFLTALPLSGAPQKVYIGVYLNDISGFDLSEGRFYADFYVWCKWVGSTNIPMLRFVNGEISEFSQSDAESDGNWHSVRWHVQGTFRGTFPLQRFPFDKQTLSIQMEIPGTGFEIMPDLAGSGMSSQFSITGWIYEPYFNTKLSLEHYYSDFGSIAHEGEPWLAKSVSFMVHLSRPLLPYVLKFVLPLVVILLVSLSVFFTNNNIEANIAIGVTGLLTAVALHSSLIDSLPNVSYMVSADKFFIFSYLTILVNIAASVVIFNIAEANQNVGKNFNRMGWKLQGGMILIGMLFILIIDSYNPPIDTYIPALKTPAHQTSKTHAVFYSPQLNSISMSLISRGLIHTVEGGKEVPFLITAIPSLTNDLVRFYPDGSVSVRWQLKPGLKWGDGFPINAEDLAFSLAMVDNTNRLKIEIKDDRSIEVYYVKKAFSIFDKFSVYPKHSCENFYRQNGKDGLEEYITTNAIPLDGPFTVKSFVAGKSALLVRNPYFAGDTPSLEEISLAATNKVFDQLVIEGKSDAVWNLSVSTFNKVQGHTNLFYMVSPSDYLYLLQPDCNIPPFNDPLFRKGLIYAINRVKIAEILFGAEGTVPDSYRPANSADYNSNVMHYGYEPEKAKAIFAKFGKNTVIRLMASTSTMKSPEAAVIWAIKSDLEQAGLKIEMVTNFKSAWDFFDAGNHGGLLYAARLSEFNNPLKFWHFQNLPSILTGYVQKFDASLFVERRTEISRVIQNIFSEQLPVIPLAFGVNRSVYQTDFHGWNPDASGTSQWWNVEYWYFE